MNNKLSEALDDILQIKYSEITSPKGSGLENKFGDILTKFDFIKISNTILSKDHKERIEKGWHTNEWFRPGLPEGRWYIHQPLGSQKKPDFLVSYDGVFFLFECKTSKTSQKITWNTSYPEPYVIYIFSEAESDMTTFFRGTVLPDSIREMYKKDPIYLEMHALAEKFNKKLQDHPENKFGYGYYLRNMYEQKGGFEKTNWCVSPGKSSREAEVLKDIDDACVTGDLEISIYRTCDNFEEGQSLRIPGHGVGIVSKVSSPKKIQVLINGIVKPMVQNYRTPKESQNYLFNYQT